MRGADSHRDRRYVLQKLAARCRRVGISSQPAPLVETSASSRPRSCRADGRMARFACGSFWTKVAEETKAAHVRRPVQNACSNISMMAQRCARTSTPKPGHNHGRVATNCTHGPFAVGLIGKAATAAAISMIAEACINSSSTATPEAAIVGLRATSPEPGPGGYAQGSKIRPCISLSNLYRVQGKIDHAIADYDTSDHINPDRADHLLSGTLYTLMEKGEIDHRAAQIIDHAIKLDPMRSGRPVGHDHAYYKKTMPRCSQVVTLPFVGPNNPRGIGGASRCP